MIAREIRSSRLLSTTDREIDCGELLRLMRRLAEPGMVVEAQRGRLVFRQLPRAVSLASRFPAVLLEVLVAGGAVRPAGQGVYALSAAGRAHLDRGSLPGQADQHRHLVLRPDPGKPGRQVAVNLREDPLALLGRHRPVAHLVGPAEIEAGSRLRHDLRIAGIVPGVTMNWDRGLAGGTGPGEGLMADQVVAARQRVNRALAAVGPDFSGILVDICGFGKGLEVLEREQALPARSGKVALAYALRNLARHYGLSNTATGLPPGPVQSWMQGEAPPASSPA